MKLPLPLRRTSRRKVDMLVLCMALLAVNGCGYLATRSYRGDGTFVDRGFNFFTRYEVILGTIALDRPQQLNFKAAGLPRRNFALGIRLDPANCPRRNSRSVVTMVVKNERGETVVDMASPLHELAWHRGEPECAQPVFGYARGTESQAERADEGHGTYFRPRRSGSYDISISFEPVGEPAAGFAGQIVLDDAGA